MDGRSWEDWVREEEGRIFEKPEALEDVMVIDISTSHAGAFICSTFLAEFGAKVIKIEPPGGDRGRRWSVESFYHKGCGLFYLSEGRNKYFITLNHNTPEGREILLTLVKKADVFIESFGPGYLDSMDLGFGKLSSINPSLIYVAYSKYGHYGPKASGYPRSYDASDQALSGLLYLTGEPEEGDKHCEAAVPTRTGSWITSYAGGAWGAFSVISALHYRFLSGRGQMIDITNSEALMRFMEYTVLWYHVSGRIRERIGYYDLAVFPYTFIRVKDGYAFIAGYTDPNFRALCRIMEREDLIDDPRFSTMDARTQPENEKALHREIEKWSINYTSDEILEKVLSYKGEGVVVFGRVNEPPDTLKEPHWWERGTFRKLNDSHYGELILQMPPWKMTETPPRVKWACRPAGFHNELIYERYLGFGSEKLKELRTKGII